MAAEHEAALSIAQDEAEEETEAAATDLKSAQTRVQELETQAAQMAAEHEAALAIAQDEAGDENEGRLGELESENERLQQEAAKLPKVVKRFKELASQAEKLKSQLAAASQVQDVAASATVKAEAEEVASKHVEALASLRRELEEGHLEEVGALRRKGGELFRKAQTAEKEKRGAVDLCNLAVNEQSVLQASLDELQGALADAKSAAEANAEYKVSSEEKEQEGRRSLDALRDELRQSQSWVEVRCGVVAVAMCGCGGVDMMVPAGAHALYVLWGEVGWVGGGGGGGGGGCGCSRAVFTCCVHVLRSRALRAHGKHI